MNKEYVYIFSNTERQDLLKIGKTTHNPRVRAEKLSRETGAIGKFIVEWFMEVPNCELAEKIIHFRLQEFHYEKEFYKTDIDNAVITSCIELSKFFEITKPIFYVKNLEIIEKELERLKKTINSLTRLFINDLESDKKLREDANKQVVERTRKVEILNSFL